MKKTARTKLAELPILWNERYTDKTQYLKDMYDDIVGPGAYFRFEGNNKKAGDNYFVVVGPAKVHAPKAKFFSGVRKLPSDFAAAGEEFDEMEEAMEHAVTTWGVTAPGTMGHYKVSDLTNIKEKVKQWKEDHKDDDKKDSPSPDSVESKTSGVNKMNGRSKYIYADTFPFYKKTISREVNSSIRLAMGAPARMGRTGFKWYDLDHAAVGMDEDYETDKAQYPALDNAFNSAWKQREKFRNMIGDFYGAEYLNSDFYHVWLCFQEDHGAYIVSIGPSFERHTANKAGVKMPYVNSEGEETAYMTEYQPQDRFDVFYRRLNVFSEEFINKQIAKRLSQYSKKYGVELEAGDYEAIEPGQMGQEFKLTPAGREKIYSQVEEYYIQKGHNLSGLVAGKGRKRKLDEAFKAEYAKWKFQLDKAYEASVEAGDAFKEQQPPPPDIKWMKPRKIGQQQNTKRTSTPGGDGGGDQTGFGSLSEGLEFIQSKSWAGCPMLDNYDDVTAVELQEARAAHDEQGGPAKDQTADQEVPSPQTIPVQQSDPQLENEPAKERFVDPGKEVEVDSTLDVSDDFLDALMNDDDSFANTMIKLVRLAETLDKEGKSEQAEDVHKILRKHTGDITKSRRRA